MQTTDAIRESIRADAVGEGFEAVAFTAADAPEIDGQRLNAFVNKGYHGTMHWLGATAKRRANPTALWADAKTAIVLAMNYAPGHNPMNNLKKTDAGNISVYARGRDYHKVIKGKLKQIAGRIAARYGVRVKVFVDTAPLMEKPLAARAGLGWQGKHSNLVSRDYGSWLFLGVILTDADWVEGVGESATGYQHQTHHRGEYCGSCRACLDICPTGAFPKPFQLDARRCISYLTIEHDGAIPFEFRRAIGNRVFGCDDCLAVCPWNRFAKAASEAKLQALPRLEMPDLSVLLALDEAGFRQYFAGTAVRRAGFKRFRRNLLIAAGNSKNSRFIKWIKPDLQSKNEVIKGAAIWALGAILPADALTRLKAQHSQGALSPQLAQEWRQAGAKD